MASKPASAGKISVTEMKLTSQTARAIGSGNWSRVEVARVHLLLDDHARIVAQFPIELAGADIDGVDARRAALQQAIGEAAGGGADVEADLARDIDREMIERGFQLESAAADVARLREQFDLARRVDVRAGLVGLLPVDQHLAGQDQRLRFLARFGEAALDHEQIQPEASWRRRQARRCTMRSASSRRRSARSSNGRNARCAASRSSSAISRDRSRP